MELNRIPPSVSAVRPNPSCSELISKPTLHTGHGGACPLAQVAWPPAPAPSPPSPPQLGPVALELEDAPPVPLPLLLTWIRPEHPEPTTTHVRMLARIFERFIVASAPFAP